MEYHADETDAETQSTRQSIASALQEIITTEKAESAKIQAEYAQKSAVGQWWEEKKAEARGVGSAVGGLLSLLKEANDLTPMQQFINAHKVAWQSWRYTDDRPYLQRFADNLTESQFKDVADVLGFDPRSISREKMADAWATANFIWDDAETQTLLLQFARDFIGAQHKLEVLEGAGQIAGEIAIDILITAITVGAGAVVVSGRKIKLLEKFKKLGPLFEKLAKAIKKRKQRKSKSGQTGSEIPEQLERPGSIINKQSNTDNPTGIGRSSDTSTQSKSRPRAERINELAKDPAHNGNTSPKSLQEAEVGLSLEESGHLRGPIIRDPRPDGGEFIDADKKVWDVKAFDSRWPPKKGGFKLDRDVAKVESEIAKGENVIIDTSNLNDEHFIALKNSLQEKGLLDKIKWWPPEIN